MKIDDIKKIEELEKIKIGKVIRIISDEKLIINLGIDHVNEDSEVQIFSISGQKIIDPDTSEFLGYYYNIKDTLKVFRVEKKYSIVGKETYTIREMTQPSIGQIMQGFNNLSSLGAKYDVRLVTPKLDVEEKDIEYLSTKAELKIKIGDLVRVVNK